MSASSAYALSCRALEKDPAPAENLTVSCANCDPDNPRAVPRKSCRACRGTGRARVALASVVGEIHASRLEMLRGGKTPRRQPEEPDED